LAVKLDAWVNPAHLEPARVAAMSARFASDPLASILIDDFLAPAPLEGVRALFEGDGAWSDFYVVRGDPLDMPKVTGDEYAVAGEHEQFSSQLALAGAAPGRELSTGVHHHLRFVHMAAQADFLDLLRRISGLELAACEGSQARIMLRAHEMRPHTDFGNGRVLCLVLYLHRMWRGPLGGRFRQFRDNELVREVEPRPNRLVVFAPSGRRQHAVEPMGTGADSWRRCSYSFWYTADSTGAVDAADTADTADTAP
jgi:2OG-Fe(II) oxygenase superfamily